MKVNLKPRWLLLFGVWLALFLLGAAHELEISAALYNPATPWARWFQNWGTAFIFVPVLGVLAFAAKNGGEKGRAAARSVFMTGVLYFAFELCGITIIKGIWGRGRYDDLLAMGALFNYTPWYAPQFFTGNTSFPSGHTAFSFGVFLLYLLALRLEKFRGGAFALCSGYVVCMAFSRIVMGRHYVTDVLAAIAWGALCMRLAVRVQEKAAGTLLKQPAKRPDK